MTSQALREPSGRGWPALVRIAREAALTVGALLGCVCLASAIAGAILRVMPLVVTSGSMSPAVDPGALALARSAQAADLRVGDIVSVQTSNGSRVTHRIASIDTDAAGTATLTLRGDANAAPDDETYRVASAERVFLTIPRAGYVVSWLGSPVGLVACALLLCLALAVLFGPRHDRSGGRGAVAGVTAAAVALGSWTGASTRSTAAYFTDAGTDASGSIAAHALAPPASASCSSAVLSATVTWPADVRYDYEVVLRRISNSAVVSTRQVTGAGNSVTYTGFSDFGLVVGAGTVDFQVEIKSKLVAAPTWVSSTARTYSAIRVVAIAVGGSVTCTT